MRHKFIYALVVLITSVTYFTSCSSYDDNAPIADVDNSAAINMHENIDPDSLESPTIVDDWVTVIFLDSAEFAEQLKIRDLRAPNRDKSGTPGTVGIKKINGFWNVTMTLGGLSVIYDTNDIDSFIPEIKAYRVRYEKKSNEFCGQAYGHVRSDSKLDIFVDIIRRVAPEQYEYAYTVGMNAKILRGEFLLTALRDL